MSKENFINDFALYDYVPIGICIIDKNFTVKCWNKCLKGWTGIGKDDILGQNLFEYYPHLENPVYKLRIDLMFNGHPPTIFSSLLHKYFFPIPITESEFQSQSATLTSIPTDEPNEYFALIAIENDTKLIGRVRNYRKMKDTALIEVEKRVKAEKNLQDHTHTLEEINATKDKFFSIIAHDLKNPFAGFLGLTQILANEMNKFSLNELQDFGVNLNKSAKNLFALLENLLEWARMQNGTVKFNPDMCVLAYLVKQNIDIVQEAAKKKKIKIQNIIPNGLLVNVDVSMLNSVFRNLITNALKFTKKNGLIEIGFIDLSIPKNDFVTIYVKDSGIGMTDQMIQKLFKIDEKVSRLGTEGESSTGLGLLLCKEFIEKHNGKIWVESIEGKGSTFYFNLPKFIIE